MPKELKHQQPTSSLAHLLNDNTLDSATAVVDEEAPRLPSGRVAGTITPVDIPQPLAPPSGEPTGEPANIPRQFQLTKTADTTLKDVVTVFGNAVGFEISNAEFLRAILHAVEHAKSTLKREARHIGRQKRFKNSRGNEALRDDLERKLAQAFVSGMRAAPEIE